MIRSQPSIKEFTLQSALQKPCYIAHQMQLKNKLKAFLHQKLKLYEKQAIYVAVV